jgi:hypothetical protein
MARLVEDMSHLLKAGHPEALFMHVIPGAGAPRPVHLFLTSEWERCSGLVCACPTPGPGRHGEQSEVFGGTNSLAGRGLSTSVRQTIAPPVGISCIARRICGIYGVPTNALY